jgi:hypothetical protein
MVDLSTVNVFPYIRAINATTNNTQIVIPKRARKMTIATRTGIAKFSYEGTDNGTPSNNNLFVMNYGYVEQKIGRGKDRPESVYVAMDSTTGTIIVSFEDE